MSALSRTALFAMLLVLASPLMAGEPDANTSFVTLPPELDRVLRDYERAWQAHDAAALSALFAENGFVLSSTKPPVRGRAAIQAAYAKAGGPLALHALASQTSGTTGFIIGVFGRTPDDTPTGKFVLALTSDASGRWLIMADIDNSSRPPTPSPSPRPPQR